MSRHGIKPTERGTLTPWRWQKEGLVRTGKETDGARHAHFLEMAEEGPCQDTESNRLCEGHSLPGHIRGRDLLRHGIKATERGTLTWTWLNWQKEGLVRTRRKPTGRGALTFWRRQREGLVRIREEADRARHTHSLKTAEGGTRQDTENNPSS